MPHDSSVEKPEGHKPKAQSERGAPSEESGCNHPNGSATAQGAANNQPSPASANHSSQAKKCDKTKWDRLNDVLETIGLFIAIVVGVVIYLQYGEMTETNRAMHQAFVADNRAWVMPFEMVIEEAPQNTNFVSLKLMFKNTGKTPAINISGNFGFGFPDSKTNMLPALRDAMMLGPDVVTFLRVSNVPRESVSQGSMFFVYGRLNYDDIFGNSHWTDFCWGPEGPAAFQSQNWPGRNTCDDAEAKPK